MDESLRLLVVEDDPNLGALLTEYLGAKGYTVELQKDGQQGFNAYKRGGHDLLLLDVMMPVKDGLTLAREIRNEDKQIPIIFLTAKSMRQDAINGFLSGADDYINKPFLMEELQLRIHAVLRRVHGVAEKEEAPTHYDIGNYAFDVRKQTLTLDEDQRKLTTKETELLRMLCVHRNSVLERSDALREIWGDDSYFNGRSMDVYIAKLRKYFKDDPGVEIVNVHGKGFRLTDRSE
ncbi:MAG: response regulator transcription factor [Flavobacteriales bacterium]